MLLPRGRNSDGFSGSFRCADLARTTIGREPELLWEVLLGMHMLQTDVEPEVFGPWRRRTRARLTAIERELLVLAPPRRLLARLPHPGGVR